MSSQKRHVILVGIFLAFFLMISYYQYAAHPSLNDHSTTSALDLVLPDQQQHILSPQDSSALSSMYASDSLKQTQPCDKGDISWLASDRQHWDGWKTKSFFLNPDGNFTLDDVTIEPENGLCIVVLLGPIPAANKIKVESHYAPPDIITMTAHGNDYSIPITLHQYPKQSNAYYSNVYFRNSDTYFLKSTTEYRSHFWETPIQHRYQPFSFESSNKAIVTRRAFKSFQQQQSERKACGDDLSLEGSWRNDTTMYEFIPDHCDMKYSRQDGLRCLRRKTIHVWADENLRRTLKTLASPSWCDMKKDPDAECVCNDDSEDPAPHPWATDPAIPLILGDNSVHYTLINDDNWRSAIQNRAPFLPSADMVILGVGDADIALSRMKPRHFARALDDMLEHLLHNIYNSPHITIIIRTPQFFGTGQHYLTAWNAGRSRAFANVVRDLVRHHPSSRVKLWDTHQLGIEHTSCRYHGTLYTRRNVIDVENQLLMGLFCSSNNDNNN